jgi:hypothetical protein
MFKQGQGPKPTPLTTPQREAQPLNQETATVAAGAEPTPSEPTPPEREKDAAGAS